MTGDPVCPRGGVCTSNCLSVCIRNLIPGEAYGSPWSESDIALAMAKRQTDEARRQARHSSAENAQLRDKVARLQAKLRNDSTNARAARKQAVREAVDRLLEQRAEHEILIGELRCRVSLQEREPSRNPIAQVDEVAELRGDVMALWQRLGDVLSLFSGKEHLYPEQMIKLANARALHALWSDVSAPTQPASKIINVRCSTCGDLIKQILRPGPMSVESECATCLDKRGAEYPPCICAHVGCPALTSSASPCKGGCGCDGCKLGYSDFLSAE